MKKIFLILVAMLTASLAFGYALKESKEGEGISIITRDTGEGSPTKKGEIKSDGTLVVEKIENAAGSQPEGGVPSGMIAPFAGATPPSGWLLCDGSEVSETTYARLFAAIGTTWNLGARQDGTGGNYSAPSGGNFRLPDLRGTFLRGTGTSSRSNGASDVTVSLGGFSDDTTSVNGLTSSHDHLSFTSGSVPNKDFGTGDFVGTTNKNQWNNDQVAHNHSLGYGANVTGSAISNPSFVGSSGGSSQITTSTYVNWNSANANIYVAKSNFDHTHSGVAVDVPSMSSTLGGDTETGARATGVTYIIKY